MRTAAVVIGIVIAAVLAVFGLALVAILLFGGSGPNEGDRIIQQHYDTCVSAGGSYKQGDGLDNFSCTRTEHQ
jgi:hypothetical protein